MGDQARRRQNRLKDLQESPIISNKSFIANLPACCYVEWCLIKDYIATLASSYSKILWFF